jgi:hypothetical protein
MVKNKELITKNPLLSLPPAGVLSSHVSPVILISEKHLGTTKGAYIGR